MITNEEFVLKLLLAILIGGFIGFEREMRSKSAGFRTLMLICIGATLFTCFSKIIGGDGNPDRIASNVVVGIGFLGAGVIFRSDVRVNGITTAASIWVTAALGVGIGCGHYFAAIAGAILIFIVLFVFPFFDNYIDRANQIRLYKISFPYEVHMQNKYEKLIGKHKLKILSRVMSKTGNMIVGTWTVSGREKDHHKFIELILDDEQVNEFDF